LREELIVFRQNSEFFLEHGVHPGYAFGWRYGLRCLHGQQCNMAARLGAKAYAQRRSFVVNEPDKHGALLAGLSTRKVCSMAFFS